MQPGVIRQTSGRATMRACEPGTAGEHFLPGAGKLSYKLQSGLLIFLISRILYDARHRPTILTVCLAQGPGAQAMAWKGNKQ
jgi:hypothetical protein